MKGVGQLASSALGSGALGIGKSLLKNVVGAGASGGLSGAKKALSSGLSSSGSQLKNLVAGEALSRLS